MNVQQFVEELLQELVHKHPLQDPGEHVKSDPLSIQEIIAELREILK